MEARTSSSVSSSVASSRKAASPSSMSRARSTVRWSRPSRSSGAGEPMKTSNGSRGAGCARARRGVGRGAAQRGLQDGALVVADQQADGGGFAVGVADPQVRGVDGDDAAVGAADAVAALPAGELERLGDAGAGAGGVRPGGEVGERLADDLLRRRSRRGPAASSFQAVMAAAAGRSGRRRRGPGRRRPAGASAGSGGAGGAGADRAFGEVELEPDVLVRGRVLDAPAGGERGAQQQAAAALAVGAGEVRGRRSGAGSRVRGSGRRPRCARRRRSRRHSTSAAVPACTTALVTSSLVRTTASSTMSAKPQPCRVSRTKARAVATERPTGSKVAAARAVITDLLIRVSAICSPMSRRPSDACRSSPPPDARRLGAVGQPDARLLTFADPRMPVAECFRPEGAVDGVRCCRTVMAWFGQGETLGKLDPEISPDEDGRPLREGHGGVWRSGAGHEHARKRRTVPEAAGRPRWIRRR